MEPCEYFEGDIAEVNVKIFNDSPFPAIFKEFTLAPIESYTESFTMKTSGVGIIEQTERLEYTNIAGRKFSIEIPLKCTVKAAEPVIDATFEPILCLEGETPVAHIKIVNTSIHDAVFENFTLKPKESRTIEQPLPEGKIGKNTSEQVIRYRNKLDKPFEKKIRIDYTVNPVEPVISASAKPLQCLEGDKTSVSVTLTNTSAFDAIFTDFTIKPNEAKTLEIPVDTKKPGDATLVYLASYHNTLGREFSQEIPLSGHITAREPVIEATVIPVTCYEGDPVKATVIFRNNAIHEAVFDAFMLKSGESHTDTVALNTTRPGENTVTYSLEYRNSVGRSFTKDIPVRYTVLPVPRPSVSITSDIRAGTEGVIEMEIANPSDTALENFVVIFDVPEDLTISNNTIELKKIGPGERRVLTVKATAPFGGDYSVMVKLSYRVGERTFGREIPVKITVESQTRVKPPAGSPVSDQKDLKAMKAGMPLDRPVTGPSANAVVPVSSVTEGTKCQVCLSEFSSAEPGAVKCPHCGNEFHYRCITKWVNKNGTCPICKKDLRV